VGAYCPARLVPTIRHPEHDRHSDRLHPRAAFLPFRVTLSERLREIQEIDNVRGASVLDFVHASVSLLRRHCYFRLAKRIYPNGRLFHPQKPHSLHCADCIQCCGGGCRFPLLRSRLTVPLRQDTGVPVHTRSRSTQYSGCHLKLLLRSSDAQ
ncbi:hypothetical protein PFISCL1PPCAC_23237, partial [Pristionchus fissidentatus]